MSWLWHSPRERPIWRAALLGDEVLVPYVSMVGLGESPREKKRGGNGTSQVMVAPASGRGKGQ